MQNRITQITDPLGNVQSYIYDGNGDLISHTNAVGNVSRYKYNRNHGLIEIQDPAGNLAARNDHDASGRLVSTTDANGNQITFTHNVGAQEELITDRRGNVTRALYDARGNVLSLEKGVTINGALVNAVTTTSYDAQNNEIENTNPDGVRNTSTFSGVLPLTQTIDPTGLNLTTSFIYNAQSDPTLVTDPAGRGYVLAYDARRNITSISTPLQGTVTAVVDSRGLGVSGTDAIGTTTVLTHDAAGNVTREDVLDVSSILLRRTDFTYDANGNKASEIVYRSISGSLTSLTTQYAYDAANREVAVTDPLGGVSRTEYDANSKVTARIDALGRRTSLTYDSLSRLTRTTYPDGTSETSTYDAEGNAVTTTDRAGRATTLTYDELKRQVKSTLPDGSSTQTIYSPGEDLRRPSTPRKSHRLHL
ncbi:MAG: RHS repeat protein [Betaproteobacteria bacterium]|nr:RHS repeat protein [Betaproteobacteria bacterium]